METSFNLEILMRNINSISERKSTRTDGLNYLIDNVYGALLDAFDEPAEISVDIERFSFDNLVELDNFLSDRHYSKNTVLERAIGTAAPAVRKTVYI